MKRIWSSLLGGGPRGSRGPPRPAALRVSLQLYYNVIHGNHHIAFTRRT